MSQKDKPPSHLKQRCGFRRGRKASGWVGFIDWLGEFRGKELSGWTKVNERDDKAVQCEPNVNQKLIPTRDDIKGLERLSESKCNKEQNEDQPRTSPKEKQPDHRPDKQQNTE